MWLRITVPAAVVTLAVLLGLAVIAGRGLGPLWVGSVDHELGEALGTASTSVAAGRPPAPVDGVILRVLDTAGAPADGGTPVPDLGQGEVRALKAGTSVHKGTMYWRGSVVTTPDGSLRLVVAGTGLVGLNTAVRTGSHWLLWAASIGAVLAAAATWLIVRMALRPVGRMRRSLRALPPGERLPVPEAHDELRSLAADFNALLVRQEEVSRRLRRFTGDAAHELRSPVASIRVQAEVAVANPDPELAQETLADILAEAERLSALLDQLLALARSDAGELPPAEPVELVTEARAAVKRLPPGSPAARVNGVVGTAWAYTAYAEVELVLNNLLRNACRYARSQIVVSVLAGHSTVRVVVDDDGPGVPPEHRDRVFDRFYRVADDRSRSSGGSGLGLAMVAEAVRRRGGRVTVGESPEGGARFQVTWRRAGNVSAS
ncbi:ATP-binding protein [Amycolatopsis acidiphila]|uniref:histidine kinase n=1 Tax=Amycolatopsis acidiphila TaxID=715473 RepID=A0A558A4E6_9PSEU|nr:ATP-binding protein [Amycolatopsis acidiphila]TVT19141.1 HAMP domain-containing protein [Amycolatopsis acidiphila]UIJ64055.1 ATP-binding protein [Amycolatopsis acidiphila]